MDELMGDGMLGELKVKKHLLLPTQGREVVHALRHAGFSQEEFEVQEREGAHAPGALLVTAIVHRPTGYYCAFDVDGGNPCLERHPGAEQGTDTQYYRNWTDELAGFIEWLSYVRREVEVGDWWAAVGTSRLSEDEPPPVLFTREEQESISKRLDELQEQLLREHELNDKEHAFIRGQIAELKNLARTQTKRKAFYSAVGWALSIARMAAANPEEVKTILRLVSEVFRPHFGGVPLLPDLTGV